MEIDVAQVEKDTYAYLGETWHLDQLNRFVYYMTEAFCQDLWNWRCLICAKPALSQNHVEQDQQINGFYVYRDLDYDQKYRTFWVQCEMCHSKYHLRCDTDCGDVEDIKMKPYRCRFRECLNVFRY